MGARTRLLRVAALVLSLCQAARADESFDAFTSRLGLTGTRRTWQLDRLRHGSESMKLEAARALAADPELLSVEAVPDAAERAALLREVVATLPEGDGAAARLRLELSRQRVGEAAACVDRLRADPGDAQAAAQAQQALAQAHDILAPVRAQGSTGRRSDPRTAALEGAELLAAWGRTMSAWLAHHGHGDVRAADLELRRAMLQFARLVDTDGDAPHAVNASADLLRTEAGAEAALGLASAMDVAGLRDDAAEWLDAVEAARPPTLAARRVPAARLAFAVDAGDAKALAAALDRMPPRSLSPSLAIATARVAAGASGDASNELAVRALDAMDAATRAAWIDRLAAQSGPMRDLAEAVRAAQAAWPALSRREMKPAEAAELAHRLRATLHAAGPRAPGSLRGEALRLQAWAERATGDDAAASVTFEHAAGESALVRPECLWMAALCEPAASDRGRARRLDLLRRQRAIDPSGPFAGRVATWLSRLDALQGDALAVAVLLAVPANDAFLCDARVEAARRLLSVAETDAEARRVSARRALQALEPVASQPAAARWRLLAALAADDLDTAAQAERDLAAADRADAAVAGALVRLQVLRGDLVAARACIDALPLDRRGAVAMAAVDELVAMQGAERRASQVELASMAVELAAGHAEQVLAARERLARAVLQAADDGAPLRRELAERVVAPLATGAEASRAQTMAHAEALRMAGRAAEAVELLQKLSASLSQGSAAWAEARWRLFDALRQLDPRRAATMLAQHLALAPDGGPAPWGVRFLQASKGAAP
jgi:hypothetical protein